MLAQPASGRVSADATRAIRIRLVIACPLIARSPITCPPCPGPSCAVTGCHQRAQRLDALACGRGRLNVRDNEIEPALGGSRITGAPSPKREQLAGREAVRTPFRGQRLK